MRGPLWTEQIEVDALVGYGALRECADDDWWRVGSFRGNKAFFTHLYVLINICVHIRPPIRLKQGLFGLEDTTMPS